MILGALCRALLPSGNAKGCTSPKKLFAVGCRAAPFSPRHIFVASLRPPFSDSSQPTRVFLVFAYFGRARTWALHGGARPPTDVV